jgi:Phosphoadenosine phosphosulfate reductase family.
MNHVVMYSGGIGSWAAAKRVAEAHGTEHLTLLFTDTKTEDPDTYRFLRESAANVGGRLVEIAEGRNIWQVFEDERYLGNTRADPCSRILKREMADRWLSVNHTPEGCVVYIGIDWSEIHRWERLAERRKPWIYEAPLCRPPYLTKTQMHQWAEREGLSKQWLYQIGAAHANCGGGCIKMGVGGFTRLYRAAPDRFAQWEHNEQRLRDLLGDVAILRDRSGGETKPLPLKVLRERIEAGYQPDLFAIGGCGCFVDGDD